ncbi:apoptosis regulator BAX-like isoform X2 [Watersipora subatra]|uniref:apoptosis regulator BAX-like isoform X2 n=1 Tax=Watersipora subatra TaxID=2589382 RepID=UPI00355B5919
MAEGGGGDKPDGNARSNPWWDQAEAYGEAADETDNRRQVIGNQARVLMASFIRDRIDRDGLGDQIREEDLYEPGTPRGPPVVGENYREIGMALRQIGDELDGDHRLQDMIDGVSADSSEVTFLDVAKEIFKDGQYNWGRVVMLFYFAYKMAKKALSNVSIIRTVIEWVVKFIRDYVAGWIISRGGWSAIQEYFGSSTGQAVANYFEGQAAQIMQACTLS